MVIGGYPRPGTASARTRVDRWTRGTITGVHRLHPVASAGGILALLVGAWALSVSIGGANIAAPHWFYLPILLAAARFGIPGALVTAVAAALLAGPALPGDVAAGVSQPALDWMTRGSFFVAIGAAMAVIIGYTRHALLREIARMELEHVVRGAIASQSLVLHYQPVVDLDSGAIVGAEVLVRLLGPEGELVPPAEFIEVAEQSDLICELGEAVLRGACEDVAGWHAAGLTSGNRFKLAVNVSARQLTDDRFPEVVRAILDSCGMRPEWLDLEITESALPDDLDHFSERIQDLRSLGVGIAIDDFGTGYSSLSYLHRLPIDVVKIDRSFVENLGSSGSGERVAESVVRLAHDLDLRTIAEGVEHPSQIAHLQRLGCGLAQGFHFAPPLHHDELTVLLRKRWTFADRVDHASLPDAAGY